MDVALTAIFPWVIGVHLGNISQAPVTFKGFHVYFLTLKGDKVLQFVACSLRSSGS